MTTPDTISEARRQLLEKFRRGELQASSDAPAPLIARSPSAEAPLSPDLEQVWLLDQMAGGAPINNESYTIHKRGPLDVAVLQGCFNEIVRRHEIWRSAFPKISGKVVQRIDTDVRVPLPLVDLTRLPDEQREAETVRIAMEDASRPFDVNVAPLFRLRLVRLAPEYHRLYLTVHRLVFDCASIDHVLIEELIALYRAYSTGQPSPLPEVALQFSDYAAWKLRQNAASHAAQMEYWRQNLSGELQPLQLPADRPRPAQPTWRSAMQTCTIPANLTEALKQLSLGEGATLYMTLLAAFQVLLYRYSGQSEIIIGGKTNARTRPEFEPLLGSFVNTIVLRNHIAADLSFRDFLTRVKGTVLGALAHSEIPFAEVGRELGHPLFQVLFSMRAPFADSADGWSLTDMEVSSGASGFDLFVEYFEHPDGLAGRFVYSTDLFDRATIQRLLVDFQALLEELVSNPGARAEPAEVNLVRAASAASDPIEHRLVAIWEELLDKRPIGVNHNFFKLGGHSMLLAKLILQIEQTFHKTLSMATVFQRPTIAQLADLLREEKTSPETCRVFPIQPQGTRPPFICLGAGPFFLPLAHNLGSDQPTLGVDLDQLDTAKFPVPARLQHLGALVVKAIREYQPQGPYYLGGFCLYGVLMYEAAQQIVADGGEVALVVMIDSPILTRNATLPFFTRMLVAFQKWAYRATLPGEARAADVPAYVWRRIKILCNKIARFRQPLNDASQAHAAGAPVENNVDTALFNACNNYIPQPYCGAVALFQPVERPSGRHWDMRQVWRKLIRGPFESYDIAGGHDGMFQEPYVKVLAGTMKNSLELAQNELPAPTSPFASATR
jgi:thioesterase domain-containing protein/acyl carrier protein